MIELATLRTKTESIQLGNVSDVWKARIEAQSGAYVAYVKDVEAHIIYTECVCAMAGRSLGLDIPKPFIVRDGSTLLFGCEDAGFDSFKQFISKGDRAIAVALSQWSGLNDAIIFDEWIANPDRNQGNFLYDGNGSFTLIDHGHAFGSPMWNTRGLSPSAVNELAMIPISLGDIAKHKLRKDAVAKSPSYDALDKGTICTNPIFTHLLRRQEQQTVLQFLIQNSMDLAAMIKARTGVQSLL